MYEITTSFAVRTKCASIARCDYPVAEGRVKKQETSSGNVSERGKGNDHRNRF